jgi:hypothetical protein
MFALIGTGFALATGGAICWRGVSTESGTSPGGRWRIRWACWRWLAEKQPIGGSWQRVAGFPMIGGKALAKAAAQESVAEAPSTTWTGPTVQLIRGRRTVE